MNTYIPEMKALWMAENVSNVIHNIYTLRGAQVRNALAWSKYIARAMFLFGDKAEVMFASHSWPRWGKKRIYEVLSGQRDAYAHLNKPGAALCQPGCDHQPDSQRLSRAEIARERLVRQGLPRFTATQQPRCNSALSWFLGCEPNDINTA